MEPMQKRLAGFIADLVEQGPMTTKYYDGVARDIISMVIDDGQYAILEEGNTESHDSLWDTIYSLEQKINSMQDVIEDEPDCDCSLSKDSSHEDTLEPIWYSIGRLEAKIDTLEQRINALQVLVEKESFAPYQRVINPLETWTCTNGGLWVKPNPHNDW